ncbi:MAG: TRAP transporter substrate-binding protein DctP [Deltaproteobacteria bacterium]|nr:TRAP transporter substrate-binding protein DctP [Deltaproteobacteria bacterium]MBW2121817.1 TRAP transporter substrate-binding protein DctP [Deltaproteobacteria bacterium]
MKPLSKRGLLSLVLVAALVVAFGTPGVTRAAKYTMVIAHHYPVDMTNNEVHPSLVRFANIVQTQTKGAIEVKIFGGMTLGTEIEYTQKAQKGKTVQSAVLSSGAFSSFFPKYQVITTPFLFSDYNVAWAFFNSRWYADFMNEMRQKTGLRWIGMFDDGGGFVAFTNNKRLIKTPKDMKGLRIRVEENPAHIAMMEALGAKAVPLEWGQVPTALQTGVADGQFNAPGLNAAMKFWEPCDYTSWTGHVYNSLNWVVNDEWFKGLPEEYQRVILRAARQAVMMGHGVSEFLTVLGWKTCCEKFKACYVPTPDEKAAFRDIMRPAFYKWATEEFGLKPEFIHETWNKVEEISKALDAEYMEKWGR